MWRCRKEFREVKLLNNEKRIQKMGWEANKQRPAGKVTTYQQALCCIHVCVCVYIYIVILVFSEHCSIAILHADPCFYVMFGVSILMTFLSEFITITTVTAAAAIVIAVTQ